MTLQYLGGELSVLLGDLRLTTSDRKQARAVASLRREAETRPPGRLGPVAHDALVLADVLCWDALGHADATTFTRRAELSARLHEFAVCAGLLADR
ncbi:MAG TPA: hypothetical protein VGL93_29485 [Streptosporangiaceae bacterium]|jgi:hypothetical protein